MNETMVEYLRLVLPLNRLRSEAGCTVVTLFDYAGIDADARLLITNETVGFRGRRQSSKKADGPSGWLHHFTPMSASAEF